MVEDSQTFPLAHYQTHLKNDEEIATMKTLKKERTNKCFIYVFSTFVFLSVALLIFALIVLRVNSPNIEFSSVSVSNLSYQNNNNSSNNSTSATFNLTLIAEITIDNSNFGPFDFENGTIGFVYGGVIVGERITNAGRAKAKGTKRINVSVEARSSNGVFDSRNVSSDLNSGILKMRSFAKLRGRVHLINMFKKITAAELDCSMGINLSTRQIQDLVCE